MRTQNDSSSTRLKTHHHPLPLRRSPANLTPPLLPPPPPPPPATGHNSGPSTASGRTPDQSTTPSTRRPARRRTRWSQGLVSKKRKRPDRDSAGTTGAGAGAAAAEHDPEHDHDQEDEERERRLSGELALACAGGRETVTPPVESPPVVAKTAPPDEDSGHGSTAAGSDEQLGKVAAGVQVRTEEGMESGVREEHAGGYGQ